MHARADPGRVQLLTRIGPQVSGGGACEASIAGTRSKAKNSVLRAKQESRISDGPLSLDRSPRMPSAYLENLNPQQRWAVEHGLAGDARMPATPLLVIAGAGSGKTNTLAHRVAHLIVNGVDPGRILLMTFSRRAAVEMTRRAGRICAQVFGSNADMTEALTWAGTFHAIGARLLREYAEQIGIDPAFTIHDREDSADLLNLVRHELGLSKTESRFPTRRPVWQSTPGP